MPGAMRRPQLNAQIAATHHRPPSLPALTRGRLDVEERTESSRGWHRDLWDPCTIPPHSRRPSMTGSVKHPVLQHDTTAFVSVDAARVLEAADGAELGSTLGTIT